MADPEARFREIYDAYSGAILAYAARRTAGAHDAADVLADTFVVAWRRIEEVPAGDDARPWLYGVARRVLANHHRSRRRRRGLDERLAKDVADLIDEAGAPGSDLEGGAVAAAFGELSDGDRELLTLLAWDGLARDEIAVVVGCTRAALRLRLHRARARFERALDRHGVKRASATGHGRSGWASARPGSEDV